LFTVDSCRPDRFSLHGNARDTTPNIDSWAKGAVVYDNAFSVSSWTAPGLVSILTGLYPWQHGVDSRDRMVRPSTQTLPKVFRQAGYAVPNLNFFTFVSYYQGLGLGEIEREYFTDKDGDELLKWLDRNGQQRFFVWYHTTTVHQPYNPPGGGASAEDSEGIAAVKRGAIVPKGSVKFVPSDRPVLLDLYDAEIENMDRFFGAVLAKLREKDLLDNTVIVLSADHGEELLEHGFVGHASTSLEAHLR
ncbi:MAG: sulfatase, partial [Acidobacteriota bacterium]